MYLKGKQALIIDDIPGMRSSLRATLSSLRIENCDQVGTAREAVEKMRGKFYDIIICDYYLGDATDGQQVLELVRRDRIISHKTLFIIVTAERTQDRVVSAADFLPDDYLVKPFTADVLGRRTISLLEKRDYFQDVYEDLDAGQYEAAIKKLEPKCATKNKYWIDTVRLLGDCLLHVGRYDDAIKVFEEIIKLKAIPWAVMGKVKGLQGLGKNAEGRQLLTGLLEQHTEYIAGYDMLATLNAEAGDLDAAQKILDKALTIVPAMHRQKRAGKLALESGNLDKAQKYLTEVVERGKYSFFKEADDYTLLSHVHMEKGDTQQARAVLDMVGKRFAASTELKAQVQIYKAKAWQKEGNNDQAKALLEPLQENPEALSEPLRMDMIKTSFQIGDNEVASKLLSDMLQSNHDNEELRNNAVQMLESVGKGDQVKDLVGSPIQEVISLNNKGAQLLREGQLDDAVQILVEAAEKLPRNGTVVLNAAYALLLKLQKAGMNAEGLANVDRYLDSVAQLPKPPAALVKVQAMRKQLGSGKGA
ncbi:MAG TPA: response regulator [Gallionella sp.]|nr:response regulator [Gallionella sp.]